jgi:hypothetical protein
MTKDEDAFHAFERRSWSAPTLSRDYHDHLAPVTSPGSRCVACVTAAELSGGIPRVIIISVRMRYPPPASPAFRPASHHWNC